MFSLLTPVYRFDFDKCTEEDLNWYIGDKYPFKAQQLKNNRFGQYGLMPNFKSPYEEAARFRQNELCIEHHSKKLQKIYGKQLSDLKKIIEILEEENNLLMVEFPERILFVITE